MLEHAEQDRDRDDREDPKGARQPVEGAIGIVDAEGDGIGVHAVTLSSRRPARHPDGVRRARLERPPVEPPVRRDRSNPARSSSARQSSGSVHQSSISARTPSARTDSSSRRAPRPSAPARRCPGSRSIQRSCVSSMSMPIGVEHVEGERPAGREPLVERRRTASRSPSSRRCRSARNGTVTSGNVPRSGSSRMSARRARASTPCGAARSPGQVEHHRRAVDADDAHAREGRRHGHARPSRHRPRAPARRMQAPGRRRRGCPR